MPAPASSAAPSPAAPASPFWTTHEPSAAFTPDGRNVAPSLHVEMEALRERVATAPEDTTALLRLARLKHDGHQTDEAIDYYRRYLALRPEARQAWLDLAQCYGEQARWADALEATRQMLDRFPDDPAALYNLGAIHANTGRPDEARAAWQRVTRQDRDPAMKTKAEAALQRLASMQP